MGGFMKKLSMFLFAAMMSSSVMAEVSNVRITSYVYVNQERKVAELCGVVDNMTRTPTFVQVTVDHNSNRPASYNTVVGPNGKFCMVVVTYFGTAVARSY